MLDLEDGVAGERLERRTCRPNRKTQGTLEVQVPAAVLAGAHDLDARAELGDRSRSSHRLEGTWAQQLNLVLHGRLPGFGTDGSR